MARKERLVIIGNGMAGGRLIEEVVAGGGADLFDIVVYGEEPHGNYNRILLSSVLAGSHQPEDIFIHPLSWYEQNGIKLNSGVKAGWIDRISKAVYAPGGLVEPYDKLVIATGSSPYLPPMTGLYDEEGAFKQGVFTFRTIGDCQKMIDYASTAEKAAVIGGGLLGLEAARGLLGRGLEVHVAHLTSYLMDTQLDPQSGAMLGQTLERLGVNIHLDKLTTTILGNDCVTGLAFKNGSVLDCDMVVVAAGIRPNLDLAKQAGLPVQHGIVVKDDLACRNDPDIYAIGECAQHRGRLYGLVAPLWEQAQILAERLTLRSPGVAYQGSRTSTKLKVMGVELAVMGGEESSLESDELVSYVDAKRGIYKKLIVRNDRLAGAIVVGDAIVVPSLLRAFTEARTLTDNRSELLFSAPAAVRPPAPELIPDNAQICDCNAVSKAQIIEAVLAGARAVGGVSR